MDILSHFNNISVSNLSASDITGGTLTIDDSLSIKTYGGAVLEDYLSGIRIYSGDGDPYFIVTNSTIYNRAGSSIIYMYKYNSTGDGVGIGISTNYGVRISAGTSGYLIGSWYLNDSSTAVTSDENKKNTIVEIDEKYNTFFDNIQDKF